MSNNLKIVAEFNPAEMGFKRRQKQIRLAGEVTEQGHFVEIRKLGDLSGGGGFESLASEKLCCRFHEAHLGNAFLR